jgi:hypothetical protein
VPSFNSLIVQSPAISKSLLMDMMGTLSYKDERIKVREEKSDANLACDAATVALITSGGLALVELIKSATSIYLDRRKSAAAEKPQPAHVTVHLTLGGKRTAIITDPKQLDEVLKGVADFAEVSRVELA